MRTEQYLAWGWLSRHVLRYRYPPLSPQSIATTYFISFYWCTICTRHETDAPDFLSLFFQVYGRLLLCNQLLLVLHGRTCKAWARYNLYLEQWTILPWRLTCLTTSIPSAVRWTCRHVASSFGSYGSIHSLPNDSVCKSPTGTSRCSSLWLFRGWQTPSS